jgi:hypothetical protein
MSSIPPETGRVVPFTAKINRVIGPASGEAEPAPIDVGGGGPHPPDMDIGERLARLESAQEWMKVVLGLIGAVTIGGFAFLGVQIGRLDTKVDGLGARISAENAATRQELIGVATAISNSITAARQIQPQIVPVPIPVPGQHSPPPGSPSGQR